MTRKKLYEDWIFVYCLPYKWSTIIKQDLFNTQKNIRYSNKKEQKKNQATN